jgi:hypothetical protein
MQWVTPPSFYDTAPKIPSSEASSTEDAKVGGGSELNEAQAMYASAQNEDAQKQDVQWFLLVRPPLPQWASCMDSHIHRL